MKAIINEGDFFVDVQEPDYSRSILLDLQKKYHLDTRTFIDSYSLGLCDNIPVDDIENWLFNFEVFNLADGDIADLEIDHFNYSQAAANDAELLTKEFRFILPSVIIGQRVLDIEEEVAITCTSSFIMYESAEMPETKNRSLVGEIKHLMTESLAYS